MKKVSYVCLIVVSSVFLLIGLNTCNPYWRTDLFRTIARGNWYITSDNDTVYTMGYHGVRKYLAEGSKELIMLAENDDFCEDRIMGRGGCVNKSFIYLTTRSYLPGAVVENGNNGQLIVLSKKDLSIVSILNYKIKLVEAKIHNDILLASGLLGFNIYDISQPNKPKEIFTYRHPTFKEYQGFDFFVQNKKVYVAFSLFAGGLEIWEISNPKIPIKRKIIPINQDWSNDAEYSGLQSMDVEVSYPFIYSTLGPVNANYNGEKDRRGLLIYDISNLDSIKKSAVFIPRSDWYKRSTGDKQPTYLTKYKDQLFLNFAEKGVAVFDISNAALPKYKGLVDISGKGALIQPVHASEKGILYTGSYYWTTVYGKAIDEINVLN